MPPEKMAFLFLKDWITRNNLEQTFLLKLGEYAFNPASVEKETMK